MSDTIQPVRRRRLWPVLIMPAILIVAAVAWSAFWFIAASKVDETVDAWRAREASSGRVYDCADRSVGGYPFRFEVRCTDASVTLVGQTASAADQPVTAKLGEILIVAQAWDPKRMIAEFTAPATLSVNNQPMMSVNWSLAQASVYGLPDVPQQGSIVFDNAEVDRISSTVQSPALRAKRIELHGRIAASSTPERPVIEAVLQLTAGSVLDIHPLLEKPFDADIRGLVSGLKDFSPKPWPQRFREIQANGGRVEITQSRIQQGDVISISKGSLGFTAAGNLDGELQMTVAGIEKIIPVLGLERVLQEGVPQATLDRLAPGVKTKDVNNLLGALDRAIPGLANMVRQNANVGLVAGINALGKETMLEGKKAREFPLRFVDGAVFLGPIRVGQIPPLF